MSRLGHSASLVCITAISRLKCIGNGWDINVTKMLLSYVKAPEGLGGDWCLQFTVGDKVKVWTDTEAPARWYYGEIKHLSTRTGTVKVEYPPCDGWPNGSHTIHDMDDGNIQFADEGHGNAVKVDKKVDTNQVLTSIVQDQPGRKRSQQLKLRPDRWDGQRGAVARSNKPFLNYQELRWAEYRRTNPAKGSTGHVGTQKFAKQVAADWN